MADHKKNSKFAGGADEADAWLGAMQDAKPAEPSGKALGPKLAKQVIGEMLDQAERRKDDPKE